MTRKRALVAGGSGFVPSHLCDLLIEKQYEVLIIDNLVTGRRENLEKCLLSGAQFIEADIRAPIRIDGPIHEIYNLASPASPVDFALMPIFILETAAIGHRNLLELGREKKSKVLYASSSEAYGDPHLHPQTETYFGNVNPVGVRSCYDEAKRYGEALSMAYFREHNLETRIVRIFNTYGPRMRPNDGRIIPAFASQALKNQPITIHGDGSQTRSYCYVQDLCEGIYALMQSSERMPTNIGNSSEYTVLEIAHKILKLTNSKSQLQYFEARENDPKRRRPDLTKARHILDYEPKVGLDAGLSITLQYFADEFEKERV